MSDILIGGMEMPIEILWESDIQESVVFKPVEIRGKRGRKKMKKANGAIYIPNMNADNFQKICDEKGLQFVYVPVPPHGRLIDADALKETLDYYIREAGWGDTANKALRWVKDEFIDSEPTVIPASEEET